jgi:hypothetical protein
MRWRLLVVLVVTGALIVSPNCRTGGAVRDADSEGGADGDGDDDADADAGSDADRDDEGDGDRDVGADADVDGGYCPPEAECCSSDECTNGIYCDGVEVCDRGICGHDPRAVMDPDTGQLIMYCDDGVDCTEDRCDEDIDSCVHLPCP